MSPDDVVSLLEKMVSLQDDKVLALARRLRPDLTADDVKNPHDFAELGDPDFQFEDGILAGYRSALVAVQAEIKRSRKENE